MDACTIIAKNYIAQARVLARSFLEFHPDGRFWTLVIDDFDGFVDPAKETFEILTPHAVGCDEFGEMAARYGVLELSTAVKPWLLRHLMAETAPPITYLDPDIKVYGSLQRLDELAAEHRVVVIPHILEPVPQDGRRPSQSDILIAGVFNLGYLSLAPSPDVERLLVWWADRLRHDCRVDPGQGYFVDQRWIDLIPGFVGDYAVIREPEYNVAYWNLHERQLDHDGRRYGVSGRPLAFFHFSGFDPNRPEALSYYQNRFRLSEHPALARMCCEYGEELLRNGLAEARAWPFDFPLLPAGGLYDELLRRLFAIAQQRDGPQESALTQAGVRSFLESLCSGAPDAPSGVHRLINEVYAAEGELQDTFLKHLGIGSAAEAVASHARDVSDALDHLSLPQESGHSVGPIRSEAASEHWGVNVVGYFRSELGVGEAARQVVGALAARRVPVLPIRCDTLTLNRRAHPYTEFAPSRAEYPVNLLCVNADAMPDFAARAGASFFANRFSIGLWFWEVDRFREEWMPAFERLDELWLPSGHVADAISGISPIPTRPMKMPVEMPAVTPRPRSELGIPSGYLFLFSFDYRSVFERKNPMAVLQAFMRSFMPGEGASLVIKCINPDADPSNHTRLVAAAGEHPDVHVIDRYFSADEKNALTAACDCYVSLHRSEGFGYTMAEAMYCGKPVIATGYSGNLEFMTRDNSLLVRHRQVPIGSNAGPYPADGEWADPDVEHAAALMRQVFRDPASGSRLGRKAAADIRRTHSLAVAGEMMERRLEQVRVNQEIWARTGLGDDWTQTLESLRKRIGAGPGMHEPANRLRRALRRGVLRALRPFTSYQESVNAEVALALTTLDRELQQTRRSLAVSSGSLLATLRYVDSPTAKAGDSRQQVQLEADSEHSKFSSEDPRQR